ncbi:MAG: hypothetical protein K9K21_07935 [Desulfotignum sp.]|nr:hypothetical protein [Desulfotignum sp.]MCF8113762.1 hypothetical protein [Desulfotignum sp.]MCF8126450.1 hypothetical protein [Desulfotignum sp.]
MKKISLTLMCLVTLAAALVFFSTTASAMDDSHDMDASDKIGELFHESMQNGYMLSYYLMDLRNQGDEKAADQSSGDHASHGEKQMDKPHHIMVYIMDKDHTPVKDAKVGFLIKNDAGETQKIMGMYMSKGFGITADMKAKGVYEITTKAVVDDVTLMDRFSHEMQ